MTDLVFFYGTLMSAFDRPGRSRIDPARGRPAQRIDSGDYLEHLKAK